MRHVFRTFIDATVLALCPLSTGGIEGTTPLGIVKRFTPFSTPSLFPSPLSFLVNSFFLLLLSLALSLASKNPRSNSNFLLTSMEERKWIRLWRCSKCSGVENIWNLFSIEYTRTNFIYPKRENIFEKSDEFATYTIYNIHVSPWSRRTREQGEELFEGEER